MSFESDKDNLFHEFFDIGKHPDIDFRIKACTDIKSRLIKLQGSKHDDYEIKFMICVIDCLLVWMIEDDKVKARKKVSEIWDIFSEMDSFTLFDIRILTAILFSAKNLDELIIFTNKALAQLEKYSEHHIYLHTKTVLNNNLSYMIMKSKYSNDKEYNQELDELLIESTNITISLSMKYENSIFAAAIVRKGILTKDNVMIYAGLSLLNTPDAKQKVEYIRDYGIFFITHSNLL